MTSTNTTNELLRKIRSVRGDVRQVAAYPDKREFLVALQKELSDLEWELYSRRIAMGYTA